MIDVSSTVPSLYHLTTEDALYHPVRGALRAAQSALMRLAPRSPDCCGFVASVTCTLKGIVNEEYVTSSFIAIEWREQTKHKQVPTNGEFKIVVYAFYELYDGLAMLISPRLETAFDQVERWNAQRSSRKRVSLYVKLKGHTRLWSSEAKFDEA